VAGKGSLRNCDEWRGRIHAGECAAGNLLHRSGKPRIQEARPIGRVPPTFSKNSKKETEPSMNWSLVWSSCPCAAIIRLSNCALFGWAFLSRRLTTMIQLLMFRVRITEGVYPSRIRCSPVKRIVSRLKLGFRSRRTIDFGQHCGM
jgi:hypothetical protein